MSSDGDDRRDLLAANYARMGSEDYRGRWQLTNRGNQAALAERQRVFGDLLRSFSSTSDSLLLDLGCGGASMLPAFDDLPKIGVDLLFERLHSANHDLAGRLANADGSALPFRSESFAVVTLFTVLSSVQDSSVRRRIADEIDRTLVAGGIVVFYDMRLPNPANRFTRPIHVQQWRALFPAYTGSVRSLTVLPPLARRMGPATKYGYRMASWAPFMRSHLAGVLRKP